VSEFLVQFPVYKRNLTVSSRRPITLELPEIQRITDRQLECLTWVQAGKSASDIGGILGLSSRTVEKHLIKLCGHLGVKTRVQAVVRARELGLIGPGAP
jgi:DNA-binding CsgD family transcriptional regulator